MEPKEIRDYVLFGKTINYLRFIPKGINFFGERLINWGIDKFFKSLDDLDLRVTSNMVFYNELKSLQNTLSEKGDDYKITEEDANQLRDIMNGLNLVINAELTNRYTYIITEKRIKVKNLLDNIKELFAPNTFKFLPDLPNFDFMEAGKCIAFERATAAGFHILRGIEGVIRWFFDLLNGSSGCSDNWGPVVTNLRNLTNPPPNEILDQLDAIRVNYRNPTAHPDMRYDIENVQDLFSECIAVVNRIVNHLLDNSLI